MTHRLDKSGSGDDREFAGFWLRQSGAAVVREGVQRRQQRVLRGLVRDFAIGQIDASFGEFRTLRERLADEILGRHYWFLVRNLHGVGGNDFGIREHRVNQRAAEGVFHQQLLQFQVRPRRDQVLLPSGFFTLRTDDLDRRERSDLDLLLVVGKCLVGECERTLLHFHVFVGVDQVPVNILDLVDRCDDLQAKGNVRNFAIVLRDSDEASVRQKSKALQQRLADGGPEVGVEAGTAGW